MGDNLRQVVGMESGTSKKNTPYTVIHTVSSFDDYAKNERNASGQKCESAYIRAEVICKVGDTVKYEYQPGYNNEAVVSGVFVVKK